MTSCLLPMLRIAVMSYVLVLITAFLLLKASVGAGMMVCAQQLSPHVPLVSQWTGVTWPKIAQGYRTLACIHLAWFYRSRTISLQSVQVDCFHHSIHTGCCWGAKLKTEKNKHLLVLFLTLSKTQQWCVFVFHVFQISCSTCWRCTCDCTA